MSNLPSYGDIQADYVLTNEEEETLRSEESQAEIQQNVEELQEEQAVQQAQVRAAEEAAAAPPTPAQAPTGDTEPQEETPAEPTGQPFDRSKDYSYYAARGMSRREWNRKRLQTMEIGGELEAFAKDPKGAAEVATAVPTGFLDYAINFANFILPESAKIPKISKYENNVAQSIRSISGVIGPTMGFTGLGMKAGRAAQARVGWSLGNTSFMKFLGARGIEAGASVAVGAISSEYESDNLLGSIKQALPPQWDYIPDNWATLEGDSADVKRQKNINEDLALGFIIPFVGAAGNFLKQTGDLKGALDPVTGVYKDAPELVGKTAKAKSFIKKAKPLDDSDELTSYALKQEDALDELGAYNLFQNPDMDVALKGVHDLYDWNEIGIRSVDDFGIVGASVDAVRIAKNYDTVYGRLGNMISPPAIKFAATNPTASEEIVMGLTKQLKDADEYGMEAKNWSISFDDVVKQGENLAIELFDPSMSVKELKQMLDPFIVKSKDGVEYVAEEGYAALFKSIAGMNKEYKGLDIARTQAYLATSLAGQVSDIAEGIRINRGSNAVFGAKERVKENLMYLMKLQGVTRYYANKKKETRKIFGKMLARGQKPKVDDVDDLPQVLNNIQREVEVFGENLDYLNTYHPKTAEALMELYELSDGKINSITKLTEDINHSFLRHRPLIDRHPDAPNILIQAVRGNYYNSMLSSFGTGASALFGNLGGIIAEPVSYFAGAALRRWDTDSLQRGWMAYSAILDTQRKALPHAGKMFMKASQNPEAVKSQFRLDLVIEQERKIAQYKKIAEEQSAQGNHAFSYFVNMYETQMNMSKDPAFRFIANAMTGFDGWTGATIANAEARFRAMNELKRLGKDITRDEVKRLADIEYNKMFDENGIVVDEAVKYNTSDIALNLETDLVKSADALMQLVPASRMFIPFPTILANVIKQTDNYVPLPFKSFQKDINELTFTSAEDFAVNPELVDQLLTSRGINVSQMDEATKLEKVIDLKNKTLGRKAIGSFITGTVLTGMFFGQIKLTGDGFYDRAVQRSRQENSDWERRTIQVGDGPRIQYEPLLGPGLSNWLAMMANLADNFDTLGEAAFENLRDKMIFTLAASTTDPLKSALTPLVDLLAGQNIDRFAAGQLNALGPLSGLRNEMGRVIDGGLKIVEQDMLSQIRNRNQLLGTFDPVNRLPELYSPVSGKIPNKYTLLQRAWNAVSPIKVHPTQSVEEKFLEDIEFDISTSFKTRDGIELTPSERSELFRLMGERGYFRDQINQIRKTAKARKTIDRLREARLRGVTSEQLDIENFDLIHYQLGVAKRNAETFAFADLDSDMRTAIDARILAARQQEEQERMGMVPDLESTINIRR